MNISQKRNGLIPGLFIITILYFFLPFISIIFALAAFLCMAIPFIILTTKKKNLWCRHYCPRASFTSVIGRKKGNYKKTPKMFNDGYLRKLLLTYFTMNLIFITGSTIQVALGNMASMPYIRLFIAIPLFPLPQLYDITISQWLLHLSYRLYSMMLSSTLLGVWFALRYRGRAWCAVCPVGTLLKKIPTRENI
ncbi:MAG: 4Fe-4S binding protein [Spirochaetia bacterium]|nr:4Fe-4S binding protein [Spirochaetia bacterium]